MLRHCAEVYHHLGRILFRTKGATARNVGDEGGFAADFKTADDVLNVIEQAVLAAQLTLGEDMFLAIDAAATEFYNAETGKYEVESERFLTSDEMVEFWKTLKRDHPALMSIEDGMAEKVSKTALNFSVACLRCTCVSWSYADE